MPRWPEKKKAKAKTKTKRKYTRRNVETMATANQAENVHNYSPSISTDAPSINDLFSMDKPKEVRRPSGVDLYTLVNNAAQFTKFLKPFITIEKQLAKATSKYQAADRARDELYVKRAQLLDKSLSE